jgi:dynein heavy chain
LIDIDIQLIVFLCLMAFSFVTSWTNQREQKSEKSNLAILFDKYVPPCLEVCRSRFKKITPIAEISHIHMLCHLLDCLLTPSNTPVDCPKEWYEIYFVFASVWAFGAAIFQDQVCIYLGCMFSLTSLVVHFSVITSRAVGY